MPGHQRLLLLLDWDETISASDTLSIISPPSRADIFQRLSQSYLDDLSAHDALHPLSTRQTLEGQLDYLASLDEVELKSQERTEKSGLFVGVTREELRERARTVQLREGWRDVERWLTARDGVEHHVISVGWSATFIEEALRAAPPLSVCANDVEMDAAGKGTGRLTKSRDAEGDGGSTSPGRSGIRTALHKQREMRRIAAGREDRPLVIYAGDSNTDLACLLDADVGLVLGKGSGLQKTLGRIELLENRWLDFGSWKEQGGTLAAAKGKLVHIENWVKGLEVLKALIGEGGDALT